MTEPTLLQPEPTERERSFFDNLRLPTNPHYDFEVDPADQVEYVNPVTLNNKLVLYSNALMELAQHTVVLNRRREKKRLELKDKQRQLRTMRNRILADNPIPPSSAKNLALTEAYIVRCLDDAGLLPGALVIENDVALLEDAVEEMKEEAENLRFTAKTIELGCTNVTVHLSFVKAELKGLR